MHWSTRGWGNGRPRHDHLDDDGEECGCYSDDSWSGWTTNIKRRRYIRCETHKRREERASRRYSRHYEAKEKYNYDTELKLKELEDFMSKIKLEYEEELRKNIKTIVDDMVPRKYLYGRPDYLHGLGYWFNMQKIRGRYYCCKNKIAYYEKWKDDMEKGMEKKRMRFIQTKRWSEEDMTLRDYKWIENNDKIWLKEYKKRIRMVQALKDEADWEVKMLSRMYF